MGRAVTLVRVDEARPRAWVELLSPVAELARTIANTDFVPRAYRGNPAAITACVLYGDEVGLEPLTSLALIRIIDGTPYMYAEAQRGLVLAAGHALWPSEWSNTRVEWSGRRRDSDEVSRVLWTMDDARRAHLDGKPTWRAQPRAMLSARASAELCRAVFADVVRGIRAHEERDDYEADDVGVVSPDVPPVATRRRRRRAVEAVPPIAPAVPVAETESPTGRPAELGPALPGEDDEAEAPLMTAPQRRRMMATFRDLGITDRGERLRLSSEIVGRRLSTAAELTVAEAADVLDALDGMRPSENDAGADSPPDAADTDPAAASPNDEDPAP